MKKLLIVQPTLTKYRSPIFDQLASNFKVGLVYSVSHSALAYGGVDVLDAPNCEHQLVDTFMLLGRPQIFYQKGLVKLLINKRPDDVIIFGNARYISLWLVLIVSKLMGIRVFTHGHGLFKKQHPSTALKLVYRLMIALSYKYICYNDFVANSLLKNGFSAKKIRSANNTLIVKDLCSPEDKTGDEEGILFVGRLRAGCAIERLIDAVKIARSRSGKDFSLHIVGSGEQERYVKDQSLNNSWIHFYGMSYDTRQIRDISLSCFAGCYPGNAGLSVVHMMALSLPPIVHGNLSQHEGPEPSYIIDGKNGFYFDPNSASESIAETIIAISSNKELLSLTQKNAFSTYNKLTIPGLSAELSEIVNEIR